MNTTKKLFIQELITDNEDCIKELEKLNDKNITLTNILKAIEIFKKYDTHKRHYRFKTYLLMEEVFKLLNKKGINYYIFTCYSSSFRFGVYFQNGILSYLIDVRDKDHFIPYTNTDFSNCKPLKMSEFINTIYDTDLKKAINELQSIID